MADSSAPNRLSDRTPVTCRGPSGTAAASPAGGIVTERTSVIACPCAFLKRKLRELIFRSRPRCCCVPDQTFLLWVACPRARALISY
eukprot:523070-Pyramimonas_sp.AAC.1